MAEKRKDSKNRVLKKGESERSDGTYMYRMTLVDGKRKSIYAKTLGELREKEKSLEKEQALAGALNYTRQKNTLGDLSFGECIKLAVEMDFSKKNSTIANMNRTIRFLEKNCFFFNTPIKDILPIHTNQFAQFLRERDIQNSSINQYMSFIRKAFVFAQKNRIIIDVPEWNNLPNDCKSREPLSKETLHEFLSVAAFYNPKIYHITIVLAGTGMRIGELLGLTIHNIDFENHLITIDHQFSTSTRTIEPPKSKAGYRQIPLMDVVENSLQVLIDFREKPEDEFSIKGFKDFLLYTSTSPNAASYNKLAEGFCQIKKICKSRNPNFNDKFSFHSMRHTACTRFIQSGMYFKDVQKILGHSDASITLSVYTHANESKDISKETRKLENNILDLLF